MNKRYIDTLLFFDYHLNPKLMLKNIVNTIKLTKKSDKDVYKQHMRLVLFGMATVGLLGFGVQFIFATISPGMIFK